MNIIASFNLQSTTPQGVVPFTIGHAFKKGDVPVGSQLVGSITDLQVITKNAWPDGSLKFAIVSGRAPLVANTPLTVSLSVGTPAAGSDLTIANLKATNLSVVVGAGTFGNASFSGTDFDTPLQNWVSGPSMSSWIYRKPIGTDTQLSAFIEVRLYAGGEVNVLPWIENGYLTKATPVSKAETFTFSLNGTQKFSAAIDLPSRCRTVLISGSNTSYWLGTDPGITFNHDKAYLQATELIPTYSFTTTPAFTLWSYLVQSYTPLVQSNFSTVMGNAGYQPAIGIIPEWDVAYATCNDPRAIAGVIFNAYSAGRYPIHYRDETTNRPIKFSSYPNLVAQGQGLPGTGASTTGTYTPQATGTQPPSWDLPHHPSIGYFAYLITGHFYFLEELQFAATINYLMNQDNYRGYSQGYFQSQAGSNTTRGAGWAIRTLAQAASATPDNDPLKTEFVSSLASNISFYHNLYIANPSNDLGVIAPYNNYTTGSGKWSEAMWQQDFFTAAIGYAISLDPGLDATTKTKQSAFFAWKAKSVVDRLGGLTANEYLYRDAATYYTQIAPNESADWFSGHGCYPNWAEVYNAAFGHYNDGVDGGLRGGNWPGSDSFWGNMQPALAYAVSHGVPDALAGYNRMINASNWADFTATLPKSPVWGIKPTSMPAVANIGGNVTHAIGSAIRFGRVRPGRITISKYHGNGIPASAIPTGFNNAALLANDVDSVNDPVGTVYRVEMLNALPTGSQLNEDSSLFIPSQADGTYTFNERVYKNGTAVYDTQLISQFGAAVATVTMVTISPLTASVAGNATQQFSATVVGTNNPSQNVTWSVNGGAISTAGLFTAPAATNVDQTITITATSVLDGTKKGTSTVNVPTIVAQQATVTSVIITPTIANVQSGATQQFNASVAGTYNPAQTVTWSTNLGTINASGLFTAPIATASNQSVIVTATSTVDGTKQATMSFIIPAQVANQPTPTVTSVTISPSSISLNSSITRQFAAIVNGTNNPAQSVNWSATAGSIDYSGFFTAPVATNVDQTITVKAISTVDTTKSATSTVTVPAQVVSTPPPVNNTATVTNVSVSPTSATVIGATSKQFTAVVNGTNSPSQNVTWTASLGSVDTTGLFTAPVAINTTQNVTVRATSVFDNTKYIEATVTVPALVVVPPDNGNPIGTLVYMHFITPDGYPVVNARVTIQLEHGAYTDSINAIYMPRALELTTDNNGVVQEHLMPCDTPYYITVEDPLSTVILNYKAIVPIVPQGQSIRLQDIVQIM